MADLTTSRINRQFRSLRMKCTSLMTMAHAPSKPSVSVTYGTSRSTVRRGLDESETPPLAILQSLDNFGARLHLDRAIVENMQLSKRIYEVRDAFRNIVQSSMGTSQTKPDEVPPRRILPLTSICARVIGEHVLSEVNASSGDLEDMDDSEADYRSQVMDALYEEVPVAYRRYMFVAHALSYILETCPHHPTLLNALLEVCSTHGLITEAHTVLSSFFAVAIQPRAQSTYLCPLTHPAHKNFLSTLRETCSASIVNDRTFTRLLVDALAEPVLTQLHAWTSKATTRLARDLREREFSGAFVPLCTGLGHSLPSARPKAKASKQHGKGGEIDRTKLYQDALERMAKWTISMLDRLHTSSRDLSSDHNACVDFLVDVAPHRLHVSDEPPASSATCLADALVCLAAYCLSSQHATSLHESNITALRDILASAHIKNTTFDGLVSHILPLPRLTMFAVPLAEPEGAETPTPPPSLPDIHEGGLEALSALAQPLRTYGLLQCEAALWLAALQHVEELISAPLVTQSMTTPGRKLTQGQLFNLRLELMDRVEDAERRCFGGGVGNGMAGAAPPSENGEWEWEEMVGSWVLKSPAPALAKKTKETVRSSKRRKVGSRAHAAPSRPEPESRVREALAAARPGASAALRSAGSSESSTSASASASACRSILSCSGKSLKRKASSASISSSRAPSRTASYKQNTSDDGENVAPSRPARTSAPSPPPTRRVSNFATILADSRMNVISLRAEREAKARAQAAKQRRSSPERRMPVSAPPAPVPSQDKPRRPYNFATLLADSRHNVVSLREERARKAQEEAQRKRRISRDMSDPEDEDDVRDEKRRRDVRVPDPESSPVRGDGLAHPSSDDALNLFAYPDSSPVRRR